MKVEAVVSVTKYHLQGIAFFSRNNSFTIKRMSTELITSWVYKNGELTKQKMDSWLIGIATIVSLVLTFTVAWPATHTSIPFTGKLNKWLLLLVFFGIALVVYYIMNFFSGSLFMLYSAIAGLEEEEILFTDHKITSTHKTWVLKDANKNLTAVSFLPSKKRELVFRVTETKPGKNSVIHTITIPVPMGEYRNAEKVLEFFKNRQA